MECRPEKANAVLDENVDICSVCKYFSQGAWMLVEDVLKRKREDPIWICSICQHDLHCELSIICESCLEWYHFIDIMCWLDCMGSLNGELVLPLLSPIMTQLVTVAVIRYTPSYFCCIVQTFHYTYHAALARQQPRILQLLVLVLFTA